VKGCDRDNFEEPNPVSGITEENQEKRQEGSRNLGKDTNQVLLQRKAATFSLQQPGMYVCVSK
jgi:hypothetical protein